MLTVRAITFFEGGLLGRGDIQARFTKEAGHSLIKDIGFDVRTLRYTLAPRILSEFQDHQVEVEILGKRLKTLRALGFRWINQPFSCDGLELSPIDASLEQSLKYLLVKEDKLFSSLSINRREDIQSGASLYAKIAKSIARSDISGFTNFRFGVGSNIGPGTPYYPFASCANEGFSVAVESLTTVTHAWHRRKSFSDVSDALREELLVLEARMEELSLALEIPFMGMDWSLAPLPNSNYSVCRIAEEISGAPIGSPGFLTAVENLTRALKLPLTEVRGIGFNGVMLSVMEDDVLARRFSDGLVSINDLVLYSAVCGCGIDMVPLAGSVSEQSISKMVADVSSLAFRLSKPLGVRFLPVDTLSEGEDTSFSHDFVTNASAAFLK